MTTINALSHRQREACRLAAAGHSNAAIGQELGIMESTVKVHLKMAYGVLGITTRSQLVAYFPEVEPIVPVEPPDGDVVPATLGDLTVEEREVVRLVAAEGKPMPVIADLLKLPLARAKAIFMAARRKVGAKNKTCMTHWYLQQTAPPTAPPTATSASLPPSSLAA